MKRISDFTVYGNRHISHVPAYLIPPAPKHKGLQLVAHKTLDDTCLGRWTVAEESTSFFIGRGHTRAAAIENAIHALAKKTPEQIEFALIFAAQHVANVKNRLENDHASV